MKQSLLPEIVLVKLPHKAILGLCLAACLFGGQIRLVQAQESTPAILPTATPTPMSSPESPASPELAAPEIQVQPPLVNEIADLRAQYRAEIENYRSLERQSTLANQQYQQLKTLVSLETAVSSLKKTLQSRVKVLDLYFTLLRLELTNATGVEISAKEILLQQIDETLIVLSEHRVEVEAANDRDALNIVAETFAPQGEVMEELSYQVQGQLTISRLQVIYDKVQITKQAVKDQTEEQVSPLQRPARDRAFAETNRNLDDVAAELTSAQLSMAGNNRISRNSYSNVLKRADSIYAGLAQSINFLSELVGL